MKSIAIAAAFAASTITDAAAQDQSRYRIETELSRQFEIVRRAFVEHGAIVDTAPDINGERTTRHSALLRGRDACTWIVATDAEVTLRRVSPARYRYSMTIDLRALDPARIEPRPLRAWQWCCRRSAEVSFVDADGRQSVPEELRLRYRFLDLRRERCTATSCCARAVIASLRRRMIEQGFTEFQTPILTAARPRARATSSCRAACIPASSTPCRRRRSSSSSC
jgi:hypothetical protein